MERVLRVDDSSEVALEDTLRCHLLREAEQVRVTSEQLEEAVGGQVRVHVVDDDARVKRDALEHEADRDLAAGDVDDTGNIALRARQREDRGRRVLGGIEHRAALHRVSEVPTALDRNELRVEAHAGDERDRLIEAEDPVREPDDARVAVRHARGWRRYAHFSRRVVLGNELTPHVLVLHDSVRILDERHRRDSRAGRADELRRRRRHADVEEALVEHLPTVVDDHLETVRLEEVLDEVPHRAAPPESGLRVVDCPAVHGAAVETRNRSRVALGNECARGREGETFADGDDTDAVREEGLIDARAGRRVGLVTERVGFLVEDLEDAVEALELLLRQRKVRLVHVVVVRRDLRPADSGQRLQAAHARHVGGKTEEIYLRHDGFLLRAS